MESQNNVPEVNTQHQNNMPPAPHHSSDKILMGILSYLGPLVIIPLLVKKDDPFVKFHVKQGLVILSIEVILWVVSSMFILWSFWPIYRIIHLGLFILSIIGIVNAVQEKQKELPLVGSLSKYFPI